MIEKLNELRELRAFAKERMNVAEMTNNNKMYEKYAKIFDEATDAIKELRKEAKC